MIEPTQREAVRPRTLSFSSADGWQPIDDPFQGDDRDFNTILEDAGYSPQEYDQGDGQVIQISEAVTDTPLTRKWQFLVEIALTIEQEHFVFVRDLPSALALVQQVSGMAASQEVVHLREIVGRFTKKAFAAMHGHELHGICEKCSPREWKLGQEHRERQRQRRRPLIKKQDEAGE